MKVPVFLIALTALCGVGCSAIGVMKGDDLRAPLRLVGGPWSLVQVQSMDDSTFTPERPDLYTLEFFENGEVAVKADCSLTRGVWRSDGSSRLAFAELGTSEDHCAENSFHDRFLSDLTYVRSHTFRNGKLYLATMADGAIFEFWQFETPEYQVVAEEKKLPPSEKLSPIKTPPSFDCDRAKRKVQKAVCASPDLTALDIRLDRLYQRALKSLPPGEVNELMAYQQGWIKGRDDCWKATDATGCITYEYQSRITELQVKVGDQPVPAAINFDCADGAELTLYFYNDTELPALVLNRREEQLLLYRVPTGSGARYEDANVSFWEKSGSAILDWRGEQLECRVRKKT